MAAELNSIFHPTSELVNQIDYILLYVLLRIYITINKPSFVKIRTCLGDRNMHNATQSQRDARATAIVQHNKLPDAGTRGYCSHLIGLVASGTVILQNRARLHKDDEHLADPSANGG